MCKKNKILLSIVISLIITGCSIGGEEFKREEQLNSFSPPVSYEQAAKKAEEVMQRLSLAEKIEMIGGHDIFFTKGYPEYGIPAIRFSDASQGISLVDYSDHLSKSVAFPSPIALASTWNVDLVMNYAKSVGEECRAGGISVLLGPGMNIYRISQCGRNFEYFGEDPFLVSRIVENYVVGLQETGTVATLKHFVANNSDFRRRTSNSVVDERTLFEIYMPAFEAGINAGAMAVMTSYNLLNGEYAAESSYVVNELLRDKLGFKWLVMSDWLSIWDAHKAIKSGIDLDMPGETEDGLYHEDDPEEYLRQEAPSLIKEGKVSEEDVDRMVKNILTTIYAMQIADPSKKELSYLDNYDIHEEVSLETSREGVVLLKNEQNALPYSPLEEGYILLAGKFVNTLAAGDGAAYVKGYDHITILDAFKEIYAEKVKYIENPSEEDYKNASMVVFTVATSDSEGSDVPFDLSDDINSEIVQISDINDKVVVVMYSGGGRNMTPWNDKVEAILYSWYPGQLGNRALAEIVAGVTNPSGKLPITIERTFADSPGATYLPKDEKLYSGWDFDFDLDHPVHDIHYTEGIFVGYRWFEKENIKPLYPFGYGLSYSTFDYSDLKTNERNYELGEEVLVKVDITNISEIPGKETVQLYIRDMESSVERPVKELKDFAKVSLDSDETKTLYFTLTQRDFAFWNTADGQWTVEPGEFEIQVGSSSADIYLKTEVKMY